MKRSNIWVEVTTLVVPGQNDSEEELKDMARFLVSVDPAIPWHISRFHPDYQFEDTSATPLETLRAAYRIGKEEGLSFIYIGNVPGESSDTLCPQCGKTLIRRGPLAVKESTLHKSRCPSCGADIAGVFA